MFIPTKDIALSKKDWSVLLIDLMDEVYKKSISIIDNSDLINTDPMIVHVLFLYVKREMPLRDDLYKMIYGYMYDNITPAQDKRFDHIIYVLSVLDNYVSPKKSSDTIKTALQGLSLIYSILRYIQGAETEHIFNIIEEHKKNIDDLLIKLF